MHALRARSLATDRGSIRSRGFVQIRERKSMSGVVQSRILRKRPSKSLTLTTFQKNPVSVEPTENQTPLVRAVAAPSLLPPALYPPPSFISNCRINFSSADKKLLVNGKHCCELREMEWKRTNAPLSLLLSEITNRPHLILFPSSGNIPPLRPRPRPRP